MDGITSLVQADGNKMTIINVHLEPDLNKRNLRGKLQRISMHWPRYPPEEQASQLKMKDFAARSKAKAKPQRREPVDSPSIIPMNERKWIDIEPGDSSLSAYEISKKVINLLRHSQTVQREDDGAVQFWKIKNYLRKQFPQVQYWSDDRWILCLAAGGGAKRRCQCCTDIFRNNCLSPSSSRTFRT